MARIRRRTVRKARIEIIPLIDVVFFLLATFVLFTLTLDRIQTLPVQFPRASAIRPSNAPDMVTVQVSGEDTVFWNGETITRDELAGRLATLKEKDPDPRVLVAGDTRTTYGAAIEVLDLVRAAGIGRVAIETRARPARAAAR